MILSSSLAALALGAAPVPPQAPAPVPPAVDQLRTEMAAPSATAIPTAPVAAANPAKPDWAPKPKPWLTAEAAKPAPKLWAPKL